MKSTNQERAFVKNAGRIVIKIGSSSLLHSNGKINIKKIESICDTLSNIQNKNKEIALVSSGAVAIGASRQGFKIRPEALEMKQALAAIGQTDLMNLYEKFFNKHNKLIAQLLLTQEDIVDSQKKEHAINVLSELFERKVIPIINENDTISIKQIEFGDNDTLSALIAKLSKADLLIILTDVDGLYDKNPQQNADAKLIRQVEKITPEIETLANGKGNEFSSGGMKTKIEAAKICASSNISMVLASGKDLKIVEDILNGEEIGTAFKFN